MFTLANNLDHQAIAKDPKLQRPGAPDPVLTEQQEFVYNWINSVDNAEFLKFKEEYKLGVRNLVFKKRKSAVSSFGLGWRYTAGVWCGVRCCDPSTGQSC